MQVYLKKFKKIANQTVFFLLPDTERRFLEHKANKFRFTQQELRLISEMALDRIRWKELPLSEVWPHDDPTNNLIQNKKVLISELLNDHKKIKNKEKSYYPFTYLDKPKTQKPVLKSMVRSQLGLGRCPVASKKTRCCNLLTLDAVERCGFDCSYCSIQSFYHDSHIIFDNSFSDKLSRLQLDPNKTYHIGTGQSSDSLMWGNYNGVMESLCNFAAQHQNVILELKTKSKNIGWVLNNPIPHNIIFTWSLNPQTIIFHEEHLSATLAQRIDSAHRLADKGCLVGFHFHPIVWYEGWEMDYQSICLRLVQEFQPKQIALISMGTLTFTKSVMKMIRNRDLTSKILQMPFEEMAGKYSYPLNIKVNLFKHIYNSLSQWHKHVFFYLCMEEKNLWKTVFGFEYYSNEEFESAMKSAYFNKINEVNSL